MNSLGSSAVALAIITAGSVYAVGQGWLGPYGMPGDVYHLVILVAVLFFTWMIFNFAVLEAE